MNMRTLLVLGAALLLAGSGVTTATAATTENRLANPGFELPAAGGKIPNWYFARYSQAEGSAEPDTTIVKTGAQSARLHQTSATGWLQLVQAVKLPPTAAGAVAELSIWVQGEAVKHGSVVFFGKLAGGAQRQWQSVQDLSGSFGWRQITKKITLEAGLTELYLAVRLNGPGLLWIDDATLTTAAPGTDSPRVAPLNGKLDPTSGLPQMWRKAMEPGAETVADFQAADGAVKLLWRHGGPSFGIATQPTDCRPGAGLKFQIEARTEGDSQAQLAVEALNREDEVIRLFESPLHRSAAFAKLAVSFRVPESATHLRLICRNVGQGTASFRAVTLQPAADADVREFPIQALVLPVEGTRVWNGGKAEFNTFTDAPVPLAFHFQGDVKGLTHPALVIELPEALRLTSVFFPHTNFLNAETPVETAVLRHGKPYRRYTLTNPAVFKILSASSYAWERKLVMAVEPAQPGLENRSFTAYWQLCAAQSAGAWHSFTVNMLPPLAELPNPKNFPFVSYTTEDINFPTAAMIAKVAKNYEAANMNARSRGHSDREREIDAQLEARGWKMCVSNPDYNCVDFAKGSKWDSVKNQAEYVRYAVPEAHKKERLKFCPEYFTTDAAFKTYFTDFLVERLKSRGLKNGEWVIFDIEPWETMDWCFCNRCRTNFAKFAKLDSTPDALAIRSQYRDLWRDFRCAATARITQMHGDAVHAAFPASKVIDYDYVVNFADPNFRSYYARVAKDSQLNEAYFDAHFSSFYHYVDKKAFDMIDLNISNLKKDYWVIGAIDRKGYLSENEVVSPAQFRLLMLATSTAGGKGFGLWPGKHIDGKFFVAINQAMAEIAFMEPITATGKRVDRELAIQPLPYQTTTFKLNGQTTTIGRPNWAPYFGSHTWKQADRYLVALFNYHAENVLFTALRGTFAPGDYTIATVDGKQRLLPEKGESWSAEALAKGILLRVSPRDATLLVIRPAVAADAALDTWGRAADFRREFSALQANAGREKSFRPLAGGALSAALGETGYILKNGTEQLTVATAGGVIDSWVVNGTDFCGLNKKLSSDLRSLAHDLFWLPENMRRDGSEAANLEFADAVLKDGRLELTLQNRTLKNQLVLAKSFILVAGKPGFTLRYKITNQGSRPLKFAFWSHNFPQVGAADALLKQTALGFDLATGARTITGQAGQWVFPTDPARHPGFQEVNGQLKSGLFTVRNPATGRGFSVQTDYAELMLAYVWFAANPTLEWIYREVTLPPRADWTTQIQFNVL